MEVVAALAEVSFYQMSIHLISAIANNQKYLIGTFAWCYMSKVFQIKFLNPKCKLLHVYNHKCLAKPVCQLGLGVGKALLIMVSDCHFLCSSKCIIKAFPHVG